MGDTMNSQSEFYQIARTAGAARETRAAARIIKRIMRDFSDDALVCVGDACVTLGREPPKFTLHIHDPRVLRKLIIRHNPVDLADAYFRGLIDIDGDLYAALSLKQYFQSLRLDWRDRIGLLTDAMRLAPTGQSGAGSVHLLFDRSRRRFENRHSKFEDQAAISFHYDVSNDFYRLWLDRQMVYSCAYFSRPSETLDAAQSNKLEHICRKLRLNYGDRLLDIGCGWGALICWAAQHHGVTAHGITLSQRQFDYASERIRRKGLVNRVSVELLDYRDLPVTSSYDKVASVGMFEHVGLANLPEYFRVVMRVLRPGGLFLNHGITHAEDGWNKTIETEFINRYIFPNGELDRLSNIQLGMERSGFEIHDVEGLRPHYALTLRHWAQRLDAHKDAALRCVDETTFRAWRLYLAACALEFESGGTGIYQILASKPDAGRWPLPLTRADLYAARPETSDL